MLTIVIRRQHNIGNGTERSCIVRRIACLLMAWLLIDVGYAGVYSWIDENGVKHFSNTPPPAGATDVTESKEIEAKPVTTDPSANNDVSVTDGKTGVGPPESTPKSAVPPAANRQQGMAQIDQEQKRLAEKLALLNQQIISAEQSRSTSSSYEYQDWTNRIERLKREIAKETEQ